MSRVLMALLAGLPGAIVGAFVVTFILALLVAVSGTDREGAGSMGAFSVGMPVGSLLGFVAGAWFVYRTAKATQGRRVGWLALGATGSMLVVWVFYLVATRS